MCAGDVVGGVLQHRPEFERPVFDAVMEHLRTLGEPFLEPVSVGVFVKRDGVGVLQLRPMTKWVALCLFMPRTVRDRRISRKPISSRTHRVPRRERARPRRCRRRREGLDHRGVGRRGG